MTDKIVVLSTCETWDDARRIARHLVEARLAACVNIVPQATSIYRWRGGIEEATELLLLIKSSRPLVEALKKELARIHPYEVPELVAVAIVDGSDSYLAWLDGELQPAPEP
jgi:periplasmic divalent cation tolerance protein